MTRRELMALLAGATALPLAARAQQSSMPRIGFLQPTSRLANSARIHAFLQGLSTHGFVEGRNVAIEYRFAEDQSGQLASLAADLVRRKVALIVAMPNPAALAAKAATATTPIVFLTATDPVAAGLVSSPNHPGGNATGLANLNLELTAKRIGLLRELAPDAVRYGALVNPNTFTPQAEVEIKSATSAIGKQIEIFRASTEPEIDIAFDGMVQNRSDVLFVRPSPFFVDRRAQITALAAHCSIPAIYHDRQFSEAGGLMSYGASLADQLRQLGIYAGRILRGEKPAELPILEPTKFELVINVKAAKALNLILPNTLRAAADEVIE